MKKILSIACLAIVLFSCKKEGRNPAVTGVWTFEQYEGGIPFVPAPRTIVFTKTKYKQIYSPNYTKTYTYQLITVNDSLQKRCANLPEGYMLDKMIVNGDERTGQLIATGDNRLRIGCGIALVYRRN